MSPFAMFLRFATLPPDRRLANATPEMMIEIARLEAVALLSTRPTAHSLTWALPHLVLAIARHGEHAQLPLTGFHGVSLVARRTDVPGAGLPPPLIDLLPPPRAVKSPQRVWRPAFFAATWKFWRLTQSCLPHTALSTLDTAAFAGSVGPVLLALAAHDPKEAYDFAIALMVLLDCAGKILDNLEEPLHLQINGLEVGGASLGHWVVGLVGPNAKSPLFGPLTTPAHSV